MFDSFFNSNNIITYNNIIEVMWNEASHVYLELDFVNIPSTPACDQHLILYYVAIWID